ncbi:MAG: nucleotidyltransferase family protein [Chlamydiales bacterium]
MSKLPISMNKRKITDFCKKYHIAYLALFGSILTPRFSHTSDVDVLVKFEKKHTPTLFDLVDIESELSAIVGRNVDLKTPNDLSPYFREDVLSHAKVIYGQ